MKKILSLLVVIVAFFCINVKAYELPEKTDHEKVTIYIFRGHGCSHCYEALQYFTENAEELGDYIEVKTYEVWNSKTNSSFLDEVLKETGDEDEGVPYIVIGKNYSEAGFSQAMAEDLVEAALKEYQNDKYTDIVASLAQEHDDIKEDTLEDAWKEENAGENQKKESSNDTLVVILIFAVVIGGGAALVYFSRKS